MKDHCKFRRNRSEAGVALLIAIFVLMLVSVVAISLLISSGTETALSLNYRSSANAYYAALAGLEEGRGRLLPKNPNYFGSLVAPPGATLPLGQVRYILNPLPGETIAPTDLGTSKTYPDTQYQSEFAAPITGAIVQTINSVSPVAGIPGSLYKWVRINAVTEKSLNLDVDPSLPHLDNNTPLFYDSAHLNGTSTGNQALEITSLAVLPNGSQKLLQYIVAPVMLNLSFPAALTLDGNNVEFTGPGSNQFNVNGNDQFAIGACHPGPSGVAAIGYTNGSDSSQSNIVSGNVQTYKSHYTGVGGVTPNVSTVSGSLPSNLQTPSGLDALVQTITQNADGVIPTGNSADQRNYLTSLVLSGAMSPTSPLTLVVKGDLDLTGWHNTGYGLLLVTGKLTYDPDVFWNGIVLVIGQGTVTGANGGNGEVDGAMLVAKTRDSSGKLLTDPNLGSASVLFDDHMGGNGIKYSSCWIKYVQTPLTYKVLSFHEIPQ